MTTTAQHATTRLTLLPRTTRVPCEEETSKERAPVTTVIFFAPGINAEGRDFTVVAPFVPTEPLAVTLRRTALPRLQRDFDDLDAPERYRPAALMALEARPRRPMQQVDRWRYCADGTRQADSTTDSRAMVATAEDQEGFALYGSIAARTDDATRDGNPEASSTYGRDKGSNGP